MTPQAAPVYMLTSCCVSQAILAVIIHSTVLHHHTHASNKAHTHVLSERLPLLQCSPGLQLEQAVLAGALDEGIIA